MTLDEFRNRLAPTEAQKDQKPQQIGSFAGLLKRRARETPQQHEETERTTVSQPTEEVISPLQPSAMIGEIFQPLRPLQDQLNELASALETIERVRPLAEALGPMTAFKEKLASTVKPIRNLEQESQQLAGVFEPMRIFVDELSGIRGALSQKLSELTRTLEPLSKLREHLAALATALEPATKLHDDFAALATVIAAAEPEANQRG